MFLNFSRLSPGVLWAAVFTLVPLAASAQRIVDFSDLSLSPDSYYNGSDSAGGYSSGGALFNNSYTYFEDFDAESWGGWAYSNVNDTLTSGFMNQYAAITGTGSGSSGIYSVAYMDTYTPTIPRIVLPEGEFISSIQVTNTTYAYRAMLDGEGPAVKFGGVSGDEPDFFRLTVTGLTAGEEFTGSVEFYLADFRFEDNDLDYIVNSWSSIDLSSLGKAARVLEFTFESSDTGIFGINTPTYVALGELALVPEPSTYALWGGLTVGLIVLGRRMRRERSPAKT